jgi:hypothetical protein
MIRKGKEIVVKGNEGFRRAIFTGVSGVHHVVSELSRRGLIALATSRNTAGVDVVVSDAKGFHADIQVKTASDKRGYFILGKKPVRVYRRFYYAFVRWLKREEHYEVFLAHSSLVRKVAEEFRAREKSKHILILGGSYFFVITGTWKKYERRLAKNWKKWKRPKDEL